MPEQTTCAACLLKPEPHPIDRCLRPSSCSCSFCEPSSQRRGPSKSARKDPLGRTGSQERPAGTSSTREVADEIGVTYRQLDHWVMKGYVVPAFRGDGSGSFHFFSEADIAHLRSVATRVKWGMTPERAFRADPGPVPDLVPAPER